MAFPALVTAGAWSPLAAVASVADREGQFKSGDALPAGGVGLRYRVTDKFKVNVRDDWPGAATTARSRFRSAKRSEAASSQSWASRCRTRVSQAWNFCQLDAFGSDSEGLGPVIPAQIAIDQRHAPGVLAVRLRREQCPSSCSARTGSSTITPCSQLSQVERGSRL